MFKKLMIGVGLTIALLTVVGCANGFDLRSTAETSVNIKLLDAEFDQAVASIQALPLNQAEKQIMNESVASLQVERQFLRVLHGESFGVVAMSAIQAQSILDEIGAAYLSGRNAYIGYLKRTGNSSEPFLESYDKSAQLAHANVQKAIKSGVGVSGAEMAKYLTLAMRTLAAINGVPLGNADNQVHNRLA